MKFMVDAQVSGSIEMFDNQGNFKKGQRDNKRIDELKSVLSRYDTSKGEIGKQLEFIGSHYKSEYF